MIKYVYFMHLQCFFGIVATCKDYLNLRIFSSNSPFHRSFRFRMDIACQVNMSLSGNTFLFSFLRILCLREQIQSDELSVMHSRRLGNFFEYA